MGRAYDNNQSLQDKITTGANVLAAERWVEENNPEHPVVTILCDRGERYFSCYED